MKFINYTLVLLTLLFSQSYLLAQDAEADTDTAVTPSYKHFVGGSLNYEQSDGFFNTQIFSRAPAYATFNIQPYAGLQLGAKTQLGLTAGYSLQQDLTAFQTTIVRANEVNLGIFVRNQLVRKERITFFLESNLNGSYEWGRYLNPRTPGVRSNDPYTGPFNFMFSLSPRVSYDFRRFRFLATFGSAGVTVRGDSKNESGQTIAFGGSKLFASALSRFFGASVEYKF